MDKLAMLKEAEVAGVLSAFTDAGMMDTLDQEAFGYLTEKVAECLDDSYTVEDIAQVTDAILRDGVEKTAEEAMLDEAAPTLGYLAMAKIAGEIDDDEFDEIASEYLDEIL